MVVYSNTGYGYQRNRLAKGAIAGIAIGAIVFLIFWLLVIWCCCFRGRKRAKRQNGGYAAGGGGGRFSRFRGGRKNQQAPMMQMGPGSGGYGPQGEYGHGQNQGNAYGPGQEAGVAPPPQTYRQA
ncbi:hypothetical protein BJ170DRAFT_617225 [Xylariales sp. AK1849]|nr:hypothetical protein BJ170DRAFT_617225 [Xylariales sp. AK1849]